MALDNWEGVINPQALVQSTTTASDQSNSLKVDSSSTFYQTGVVESGSISDAPASGGLHYKASAPDYTVAVNHGAYLRVQSSRDWYFAGFDFANNHVFLAKVTDSVVPHIVERENVSFNTTANTFYKFEVEFYDTGTALGVSMTQKDGGAVVTGSELRDPNPSFSSGGGIGIGSCPAPINELPNDCYLDSVEVRY